MNDFAFWGMIIGAVSLGLLLGVLSGGFGFALGSLVYAAIGVVVGAGVGALAGAAIGGLMIGMDPNSLPPADSTNIKHLIECSLDQGGGSLRISSGGNRIFKVDKADMLSQPNLIRQTIEKVTDSISIASSDVVSVSFGEQVQPALQEIIIEEFRSKGYRVNLEAEE